MSIEMVQATIPVFLRYLGRLEKLVSLAQSDARAPALMAARLAPDMHAFESQVIIASGFALRTCFPLAGKAIPDGGEFPSSFDGLRARIVHVTELLRSLPSSDFEGADQRTIESRAGNALVRLKGDEFLLQYALPNFFFHLTAAYAILRHHGVAVGKEDFDGWHAY
jgi:uncharacterized protein